MKKNFKVKGKRIGFKAPVFIIAEVGCNFEGDLSRAKEMIRQAARAGCDAVKLQTFTADKLTTKTAKKFWDIEGCPGNTQYEEFKEMPNLSLDQYMELKKIAEKEKIIFFSTPEDEDSADLLEKSGVALYKISSMNITHFPLLKYISEKGKPVILSTGASTLPEIREAVGVIRARGNKKIVLLHCISNYPTCDKNANLRMIAGLKEAFPDIPIGYSDHTIPDAGEGILAAAVALGAKIIEKHFTFDNSRPGYDHVISADYEGMKNIVKQIRRVENALGEKYKRPIPSESKARLHARRSIVSVSRIFKGKIVRKEDLGIKRPGTGIEPKYLDKIIGKKAMVNIPIDAVLRWGMFK